MRYEKAAILGATGPAGLYIASELRKRGVPFRAVARDQAKLERLFRSDDVDHCRADVTRPAEARRALADCDLAFHCIGTPTDAMHQHRLAAQAVADAMAALGTRCVHVSSFWSFLPVVATPMTEMHPRHGGTAWMRDRRDAEDTLRAAGAAIANLADFYGPGVHSSSLQQALFNAAYHKSIYWVGAIDTPRPYCYLPDAAATLVELANRPAAFGHNWLLPTAGPLTGRECRDIANAAQDTHLKVHGSSLRLLNTLSLVNAPLRGIRQLLPEYVKPLSIDASHIEGLMGPQHVTGYPEGIRQTLSWYQATNENN